jgi:hypothetical protein
VLRLQGLQLLLLLLLVLQQQYAKESGEGLLMNTESSWRAYSA